MANNIHKIKLLVLWDILCKNTDEDHAMNTDEIIARLADRGRRRCGDTAVASDLGSTRTGGRRAHKNSRKAIPPMPKV